MASNISHALPAQAHRRRAQLGARHHHHHHHQPRQNPIRNTAPAHPASTAARAPARRGSAASRLAAAALRASGSCQTSLDAGRTDTTVACCAARQNPHSFKNARKKREKTPNGRPVNLATARTSQTHTFRALDHFHSTCRQRHTRVNRSAAASFSSQHRHQPGERSLRLDSMRLLIRSSIPELPFEPLHQIVYSDEVCELILADRLPPPDSYSNSAAFS